MINKCLLKFSKVFVAVFVLTLLICHHMRYLLCKKFLCRCFLVNGREPLA